MSENGETLLSPASDMFEVPGDRLRELREYEVLAKDCEQFLKAARPLLGLATGNSLGAQADELLDRFDQEREFRSAA